jgi:hypothetical protein
MKKSGSRINPLITISTLIGVVEWAFAYPVSRLSDSNQTLVVRFMVLFPFALMAGFFAVVWFRPGHLYGPADYGSNADFLRAIGKIPAIVSPQSDVPAFLGAGSSDPEDTVRSRRLNP